MEVRWTQEALVQLIEIERFIAKDSPAKASIFVDQLINHAQNSLPGNPRLGRAVPELANPDIRELLFKRYRIVYRLKNTAIEIVSVFEGHRLLRIDDLGL